MLCTAFVTLGILSQQLTGVPPFSALDALERSAEAEREKALYDTAAEAQRKLDEQMFVTRFNELVAALQQFSVKYKSRHVIDVKNVEAIRKAYRKLEDSDAWFKLKE
jgi:hypothetical protein